jgi:hypothetical protein
MSLNWFNLGARSILFRTNRSQSGIRVVPWNLFRRHTSDGDRWWGGGILQIGNRHLFYVGHTGVCIGFVWVAGGHR